MPAQEVALNKTQKETFRHSLAYDANEVFTMQDCF
jgi:hypothetical protein